MVESLLRLWMCDKIQIWKGLENLSMLRVRFKYNLYKSQEIKDKKKNFDNSF